MSISKRLKAAGYKGPHPLASWAPAAVGNLGQLDHPESNRRIAERLLAGPVAPRPAKGTPDPGCIVADDPAFAELVREFGIPAPGAVTPEGAWYRMGSSFYRIGEGPFPKYLHPTGQLGEPWRPELPTAATKLERAAELPTAATKLERAAELPTAAAKPPTLDQVRDQVRDQELQAAARTAIRAVFDSIDERHRAAVEVTPPSPTAPRRAKRSRKKVVWQDVSLPEILPDDPPGGVSNVAIIEKVATHLELLEDQCPTVGDIALIWFSEREQPHTLEAMTSLTEGERETLRQALAEFRRRQGWDARIGMPDGFPLAWLRPEPTADIVIDPMAAANREQPAPSRASPAETDVIRGKVINPRKKKFGGCGQLVFFDTGSIGCVIKREEEASCR